MTAANSANNWRGSIIVLFDRADSFRLDAPGKPEALPVTIWSVRLKVKVYSKKDWSKRPVKTQVGCMTRYKVIETMKAYAQSDSGIKNTEILREIVSSRDASSSGLMIGLSRAELRLPFRLLKTVKY